VSTPLPPTTLFPPNARVQVQPGMIVQAAAVITPGTAATLVTAQGFKPNVTVNVQAGMNVRAVVLVNSAGQFVTL
jgi:NAD(P)H-nitrite reductase large subunit